MIRITAYQCSPEAGTLSHTRDTDTTKDPNLLNWLIFSTGSFTSSRLKVAWRLDQLAGMVLATLPKEVVGRLSEPPHKAFYGNYRLFYIAGKVFGVSKNGSDADFYDLHQFFPNEPVPDGVVELQAKANQLQSALEGFGIDSPRSLASPHACFRDHDLLKSLEGAIPSITDLPDEWMDAQEIAFQTTPRAWISNYKVGHFPRLWRADIASAFPAKASNLPDLRECSIEETTDERDLMKAQAGFAIGDFYVRDDHPYSFCSPFMTENEDGVPVNFVGLKRDYSCSLDDIRTLYELEMGKFTLRKGWAINWDKPNYPLRDPMNTLFGLRGDDPLQSYLLKRVMNGIIGRLLEVRRDKDGGLIEFGNNFNPLCHAMITNPVRHKVFHTIVEQGITEWELARVCVDGLYSTRRLSFPATAPMGEWRSEGSVPAFILSAEQVITPDRKIKGTTYDDLLLECASRPTAYLLGKDSEDPIDLKTLFLRQNRYFPSLPETAEDLLLKEYNSSTILMEE